MVHGVAAEFWPFGKACESLRYPQRSRGASATPPMVKIRATLRAAALLVDSIVGSAVKARFGDSPASPPWIRPK